MKSQNDSKADALSSGKSAGQHPSHIEKALTDKEKLDSLMEISRHLAHEFNNLLTTILANTQLALLVVDDERVSSHLNIVEEVSGEAGIAVRRFQESLHGLASMSRQKDI